MSELMDIVNTFDEVIGTVSQQEIYKGGHIHRVVHVFVFNAKGELALQKRSQDDTFLPGYWFGSVGGHVQSGETYEGAAYREMYEEIGIQIPLKFIGKQLYTGIYNAGIKKFQSLYEVMYDGELICNAHETEFINYFSLQEINHMILEGEKFQPELIDLLKKYYNLMDLGKTHG